MKVKSYKFQPRTDSPEAKKAKSRREKGYKIRTHIFALLFFILILSFYSSAYGVDFSCPGGQWVTISDCSRSPREAPWYCSPGSGYGPNVCTSGDLRYTSWWCTSWSNTGCDGAPFTCGTGNITTTPCQASCKFFGNNNCYVDNIYKIKVEQYQCPAVCTDGQTQSCYSGPAGTENNGECKAGTQTCVNGQWGACVDEVLPQAEICGDGKDNNCDGQVDEGCCEVSVKVSPSMVWPQKTGGKTEADVVATLSNSAPSGGCNIGFNVEPIAYSGEHNHHDTDRLMGTVTPNSISFSEGEAGAKAAKYKSSEVAGEEKIKVKVNDKDTSETVIQIKVPGFFELGAGDGYALIGQTATHPKNHFGTENTLYSLLDLADALSESGKGTLRINDISLMWGGLFDWDVKNTPWRPPHKSHRLGKNVDIDDVTAEGKKITERSLETLIKELKAKIAILNEGNHFHLTFP